MGEPKRTRGRLAVNLIAPLALAFVTVFSGAASYLATRLQDSAFEELDARARLLAETFAHNAVAPLEGGDLARLDTLVQGMLRNPDTLEVRISDTDGRQLLFASADGVSDVRTSDPLLVEATARNPQGAEVGHVTMFVSTERTLREAGRLKKQIGIVSIALLALCLGVSLFLGRIVERPLRDLLRATRRVSEGDLTVRVSQRSNDEVGELSRAFNRMVGDLERARVEVMRERDDLERRVSERTEALRAASEHAQQSSRMKSEFLANMSHEIRTPINGILGMTEIVLDSNLDDDQRDCLETIRMSGQSLLGVINDILDSSKIEAGKLAIEHVPLDIRELLDQVVRTSRYAAQSRGLELTATTADGVPRQILGDPVRLRQVLINLVGNAVKFTEKGHVDITVRPADEPGLLELAVRDTGVGIPSDKLELIFDAFSQADGSTTRKFGGTGLGLSISSKLVELMGGRLGVESDPGKGSTFRFTIRAEVVRDAGPVGSESRTEAQPLPALELLVAEDNPVNRLVAEKILSRLGHRVTLVQNGAEAVETAAGRRFDAILMDVQMPIMDGFDATRQIRERDEEVPIVALTAHAMRGDRERCVAAGMNDYVAKPFTAEQVTDALRRLLVSATSA